MHAIVFGCRFVFCMLCAAVVRGAVVVVAGSCRLSLTVDVHTVQRLHLLWIIMRCRLLCGTVACLHSLSLLILRSLQLCPSCSPVVTACSSCPACRVVLHCRRCSDIRCRSTAALCFVPYWLHLWHLRPWRVPLRGSCRRCAGSCAALFTSFLRSPLPVITPVWDEQLLPCFHSPRRHH